MLRRTPRHAVAARYSGRPLRILLLDDNDLDRQRLRRMLSVIGRDRFEVFEARALTSSLDICIAQEGRLDLLLVNYFLGWGDTGIQALALLRRAGVLPEAKAVLYSSRMTERTTAEALAAGFDETAHTDNIDSVTIRDLLNRYFPPDPAIAITSNPSVDAPRKRRAPTRRAPRGDTP